MKYALKSWFYENSRKVGLIDPLYNVWQEYGKVLYPEYIKKNFPYWLNSRKYDPPIPPINLISFVTSAPDINYFLESGVLGFQSVVKALEKQGVHLDDLRSILDFGCGCGRVTRQFDNLSNAEVYGIDIYAKLIAWCKKNLKFADFEVNNQYPPTQFSENKFDLIYSFSVFTHTSEDLQIPWIQELTRILKPGGYLLITTQGNHYFQDDSYVQTGKISPEEKELFNSGKLIVQYGTKVESGSNICMVYHPVAYVREILAQQLEVVDYIPEGAKGTPYQDIWLLRKPFGLPSP